MKRIYVFFLPLLLAVFMSCEPTVVKVACVGDSITEGDGLADRANESYPAVLSQLLGSGYRVLNFGQSGATLLKNGDWPYWKKIAYRNVLAYEPDIVIVQLGTNDSKQQNIPSYPGEFIEDLRSLVDNFQSLPSEPDIYLCKPVPSVENRFNISDSVLQAEVIPAIDQVAAEKKCKIIDLHTAFSDKMYLFPDGVHPDKVGAEKVAEFIANSLK